MTKEEREAIDLGIAEWKEKWDRELHEWWLAFVAELDTDPEPEDI